jgi:hypothetical protein
LKTKTRESTPRVPSPPPSAPDRAIHPIASHRIPSPLPSPVPSPPTPRDASIETHRTRNFFSPLDDEDDPRATVHRPRDARIDAIAPRAFARPTTAPLAVVVIVITARARLRRRRIATRRRRIAHV